MVESLPGWRVFAAAPITFDGLWMDHYLETFAGVRVIGTPIKSMRQIFRGGGVDLYTMAGTLRGAEYLKWGMQRVPPAWYGNIVHTHRAIDDARGYAHLLGRLLAMTRERAVPGGDYRGPPRSKADGGADYAAAASHAAEGA